MKRCKQCLEEMRRDYNHPSYFHVDPVLGYLCQNGGYPYTTHTDGGYVTYSSGEDDTYEAKE